MSKESRRRQRQAGQVPAAGSTANRPAGAGAAAGAGAGGPSGPTSAPRSSGPRGSDRAGRRDRARPVAKASFFERYRPIIVGAAIVAVLAVVVAGVFSSSTAKAYSCTTIWQPSPTASPAEGASAQPGYVQPDMGAVHVPPGTQVAYTNCPPASGRHFNSSTGAGPIAARVYGPSDAVIPQGWVHNLEHGGLVILYKGEAVDEAALSALFDAIPNSPICGFPPGGSSPGPVIARFDDMAWPFAAVVWDVVLPLETLDQQAILDFYAAWGDKTNPELLPGCVRPTPSPVPSGSVAPSASPSASVAPSTAPSVTPSAAPSGSAAPSAFPS